MAKEREVGGFIEAKNIKGNRRYEMKTDKPKKRR